MKIVLIFVLVCLFVYTHSIVHNSECFKINAARFCYKEFFPFYKDCLIDVIQNNGCFKHKCMHQQDCRDIKNNKQSLRPSSISSPLFPTSQTALVPFNSPTKRLPETTTGKTIGKSIINTTDINNITLHESEYITLTNIENNSFNNSNILSKTSKIDQNIVKDTLPIHTNIVNQTNARNNISIDLFFNLTTNSDIVFFKSTNSNSVIENTNSFNITSNRVMVQTDDNMQNNLQDNIAENNLNESLYSNTDFLNTSNINNITFQTTGNNQTLEHPIYRFNGLHFSFYFLILLLGLAFIGLIVVIVYCYCKRRAETEQTYEIETISIQKTDQLSTPNSNEMLDSNDPNNQPTTQYQTFPQIDCLQSIQSKYYTLPLDAIRTLQTTPDTHFYDLPIHNLLSKQQSRPTKHNNPQRPLSLTSPIPPLSFQLAELNNQSDINSRLPPI